VIQKLLSENFEMPRCWRMKRKRPSKFEITASWNGGRKFLQDFGNFWIQFPNACFGKMLVSDFEKLQCVSDQIRS